MVNVNRSSYSAIARCLGITEEVALVSPLENDNVAQMSQRRYD